LAIELKDTGQLVGDCGLKVHQRDTQQAKIGFGLSGDYHGSGLASETVSCPLDYAFIHLHLHRIIAVTDCQNALCVALLERLGFRRDASPEVSQEQETAACRERVPTCVVASPLRYGSVALS
jgi:RimJ/RimL family protein N-acetyltransferase